jgi:hypothetical protein
MTAKAAVSQLSAEQPRGNAELEDRLGRRGPIITG